MVTRPTRAVVWMRVLGVALGALAVLAGTFSLLVWGLTHGWFPEGQRQLLVWGLTRGLGVEARIGSAQGSALDALVVRDVELRGLDGPAIRIETLSLRFDLSRLAAERILRVPSLEIAGGQFEVLRTPAGLWRLEHWPEHPDPAEGEAAEASAEEESAGPSEWRFELGEIVLSEVRAGVRWWDGEIESRIASRIDGSARELHWPAPDRPWPEEAEARVALEAGILGHLDLASGALAATFADGRLHILPSHLRFEGSELAAVSLEGTTEFLIVPGDAEIGGEARRALGLGALDASIAFQGLDLIALSRPPLEAWGIALESSPGEPISQLEGTLAIRTVEAEVGGNRRPLARDLLTRDWRVSLALDPSRIGNHRIESLSLEGRVQPESRRWSFEHGRLASSLGTADLAGRGAGPIEALAGDVRDVDLAALSNLLTRLPALTGSVTASADLEGDLRDPSGSLSLETESLRIEERPPVNFALDAQLLGGRRYRVDALSFATLAPTAIEIRSSGPSQLSLAADGIEVESLRLVGTAGRVAVAGGLYRDRIRDLRVQLDALDLRAFETLLGPVEGIVSGQLRGDGFLPAPSLEADLEWLGPGIGDVRAERFHLRAEAQGEILDLEASLTVGERQPIVATATIPDFSELPALESPFDLLREPGVRAALRVDALRAHEAAKLLGIPPERLGGELTGEINLAGSAESPKLSGNVRWAGVVLGGAKADELVLNLATHGEMLRVTLGLFEAGENQLHARAWIRLLDALRNPEALQLDPETVAELRARELGLAWVLNRVPTDSNRIPKTSGHLDGLLEVRGSGNGLEMRGELLVVDGYIDDHLLEEPLGPMDGRFVFSQSRIEVDVMRIASRDGDAVLSGTLDWGIDGVERVDLEGRFDDYYLTQLPFVLGRIDGEISVRGEPDALRAEGDLLVRKVILALPEKRDPILKEVRVRGMESGDLTSIREGDGVRSRIVDRAAADISLAIEPGARVRGSGLTLQIDGGLQLLKEPGGRAQLVGDIQIARGTYRLRGRNFEVERGALSFTQDRLSDPWLSFVARHEVRGVVIFVDVAGRASDLRLELRSDPPMDDTEIVSFLMFGRPSTELSESDGEQLEVAAAQAAAAQVLAELFLNDLGSSLAQELPVDRISIGIDDESTLPTLEVEKQLTEDILVRYDRAFDPQGGDHVEVEWRFWRHFNLQSEVASDGSSGVNLIWSRDY